MGSRGVPVIYLYAVCGLLWSASAFGETRDLRGSTVSVGQTQVVAVPQVGSAAVGGGGSGMEGQDALCRSLGDARVPRRRGTATLGRKAGLFDGGLYVVLSRGEKFGFKTGQQVCFFEPLPQPKPQPKPHKKHGKAKGNAREQKEYQEYQEHLEQNHEERRSPQGDLATATSTAPLACGTVVRVDSLRAIVRIPGRDLYDNLASCDVARVVKREPAPSRLELLYVMTLATPTSYSRLGYVAPENDSPPSLWRGEERQGSSVQGVGLQWRMERDDLPRLAFGIRYRLLPPVTTVADYDHRIPPGGTQPPFDLYTQTTVSGYDAGGWIDLYTRPSRVWHAIYYQFGGGVDVDKAVVSYSSDYHDASGASPTRNLVTGKSSLSVVSGRIINDFSVRGDNWSLDLAGVFLLPIFSFSPTSTFSSTDGNEPLLGGPTEHGDAQNALSLSRSPYGLEVTVGLARSL